MKFAIRQLLKSPGFTIISLVTLALGIGINTTAFTILNKLLLQSLPFPESGRIVEIWRTEPQSNSLAQCPGDFFDERAQSTVFERMAIHYVSGQSSLAEKGQPAQPATILVSSADFLHIIGVQPILGRGFNAEDQAHDAPVIILSNSYWRKHLGSDEKVLGHVMRLNAQTVTVIGVMPPSMDDPLLFGGNLDLWSLDPTDVNKTLRDMGWYQVAARLKPGVTIGQAQAEMSAIASRLAHDFPKTNATRGFRVAPYPTDSMGDVGRNIVWMIMDLALVVLLIACVNLANLQLVRTTGRSREFAIRLALGSPRKRLVGMLLLESLIVSLAGGALGLLVAKWGNLYVEAFFEIKMPLEYRVLAFAFAASALTGAIFGTLPAWMATRSDVNSALKQGSRGSTSDRSRHRLRHSLIVVELAMALTLLTGAGYFIRGIQRIAHSEQGWRPENLMIGSISLSHERYGEQRDERSRVFGERLAAELKALPGVDHASVSTGGFPILDGGYGGDAFAIEGQPVPPKGKEPQASASMVSPDFFATSGIRLLKGRDFTDADRTGAPRVAIISKSLGTKFWPGEDPIGRRIGGTDPANPEWCEVVGIVDDINGMGNVKAPETHYELYRAFAQNTHRFMGFSLHSEHDIRPLQESVRKVLAKLDPDVATGFVDTVENVMKSNMSGFNFVRHILIEIAGLGLLLSSVGLYGVIANLASERTQEIGIRMALGAQPRDVLWLLLRNGITLALIGTAIGVASSYALMVTLNKAVIYVPGNDPWMLVVVALLLVLVALFACWVPARRATKVSPLVALRSD